MPATTARVPTAYASRYLQQLCKHWAHKLEVDFTPERGTVKFADGTFATLVAAPDALDIRIDKGETETLETMQGVVARHLDRFAFREAPLPFDWKDAA